MNAPAAYRLVIGILFLPLLSGCTSIPTPAPPKEGGFLPVEVENQRGSTVQATVSVSEPFSHGLLGQADTEVAPFARTALAPVQVAYGEYILSVEIGGGRREANVQFGPESEYFRFVVHDYDISFRSG